MTENHYSLDISSNRLFSTQLLSLNERLEQAALHNLQHYLDNHPNQSFTVAEKQAIVKMEKLKLAGDLTLAEVVLRGEIIREIEIFGYWSAHPLGFNSIEEAAESQGISPSEYSNIRDLNDIIFPYLTRVGYNIAELWEEIGKSKFRELVPLLKRAITNEASRSRRVESIFEDEINQIFASASTMDEGLSETEARQILVEQLLEAGSLPVRELRRVISPQPSTLLEAWQMPYSDNKNLIVMVLDANQLTNLMHRLDGYIDFNEISQEDMQDLMTSSQLI